ncbi:hypothetical protein CO051_05655 [Candidatus Roizmanbacteria bacterium CG_4_9_14_0_2_um_filter_39_13]|uniref:Uncharacterized protein n=2 Tax=Candidatus Roizmaniibacteriota TaxID=1752723 RepID=A0A2M8EX53_9BACT|nr:MAG: hypothetical protein COY15_05345 [Candidatus Roizmanbacteria bacterium CG_4_10_14_0_2_um_filter_39_12]PJC30447.1 MAG: hypothetical protein CO051_05655 [Candidatus Roizmanbacteria bacterium CG_4_9_14_0_2_um_filter_39_13]PJE62203.1 MAG: hypothetical protein COU87_00455 [Candidatus Roizmanbacteria bacterium CG10_big_fil_rev_8_21_14_0_10_39_12]
MITDQDIKKLSKVFATKDDLKNFATKEDLNKMKDEMQDEIIGSITQEILKIYELLDKNTEKEHMLYKEQRGHRIAIGDHEDRIRLLEHPHQV